MENITQNELKCVRYITCEMSKHDRSIFEIELTLDDELKAIYEEFKKAWLNYPLPATQNKVNKDIKNKKPKSSQKSTVRKVLISSTLLLVILGSTYTYLSSQETYYTNFKKAIKGETFSLTLPDSSKIILNSLSEIKYKNDFLNKREVWLTGQAFFNVTKDSSSPFIVHTEDFEITVLGTSFDVDSQSLQRSISLVEGKVKVLLKETEDEINLLPNEQVVWNSSTKEVYKRNFDVTTVLAWQEHTLIFDNIPLKDALKNIDQFYGVNLVIQDPILAQQKITGAFKDQNLDELFISLAFIANVKIIPTIEGQYLITKSDEK